MTPGFVLRRLDWLLIGSTAAILLFSYITIDAGSARSGDSTRQIIYVAVAVAIAVVVASVDPLVYRSLAWWGYGAAVVLLVVVLGSAATRGSSRWITLPGFNLQPSEFGKIALVVCLARIISARTDDQRASWRLLGRTLVCTIPLFLLVFVEPDLGTSIVYGAILVTMLILGGLGWRQISLMFASIAVAVISVFSLLPAAGIQVLQPYQRARLTAFLEPASASQVAYQTEQSKIAIGSGGLLGRGPDQAAVTNLDFLPARTTDFIFSVVGEQRGFLGTAGLLALLAIVIWRIVRAVVVARSDFEGLVAAGIAGYLMTQTFVNVGMTVGIMPTTGIPLPLMTYGGSNTVTTIIAIGMVVSIALRGAQAQHDARVVAGIAERERLRRVRALRRERLARRGSRRSGASSSAT